MCGNLLNIMFKVLRMFEEVSRDNKLEEPNKCTPKKKKDNKSVGCFYFHSSFPIVLEPIRSYLEVFVNHQNGNNSSGHLT